MKTLFATVFIIICAGGGWFYYIGPHRHDGSKPPLETGITYAISAEVELFASRNGGVWPTSWSQLTNLTRFNQSLVRKRNVVIPEFYAFAPTNLTMTGFHKGTAIIIQRKPIRINFGGKEGRYVVYYNSDREFEFRYIPESEIQEVFSKFGVTLPPPNPEEVRAAREAVDKAAAEEKAMWERVRQNAPKPTAAE